MSVFGAPLLASTSSSVQSHVIKSVELKLDPMWPAGLHDHVERIEPAHVGQQPRALDGIGRCAAHRVDRRQRHVRKSALAGELYVGMIFFAHQSLAISH